MVDYKELSLDAMQALFDNKTISLVCNGGSIFSGDYAKIIDSADIVVRFNNGCFIYKKYMEKLGEKCDIHCLSGYYYKTGSARETFDNFMEDTSGLPIFFSRSILPHTDNMKANNLFVQKEYLQSIKGRHVFFMPSDLLAEYNFTSGVSIVLFMLKYIKFKKINVFGMDFYKNSKFHYWDIESDAKKNVWHNVLFEEYIIKYIKENCKEIIIF